MAKVINIDIEENKVTKELMDCFLKVHKSMGPGLLESIHEAQIISYLKLSQLPVGFLVNFNVPLIKSGVKRFVHNFKETSAHSAPPR